MNNSRTLEDLYAKYRIDRLAYGARSDKLGDLYEDYVKIIFSSEEVISNFNSGKKPLTTEEEVVYNTLMPHGIPYVKSIKALDVPKRASKGSPKTDVHLLVNGMVNIKLSIKHSYATNITVAEFDVDTIKKEIGIKDERIIYLMEKHQRDASAKNFDEEERVELRKRLSAIKRRLVKWALSGSPDVSSEDPRIANHTIMFKIDRFNYRLKDFSSYTIEDQVNKIIEKKSGFGTGLSWTYATGTKGQKIQFKCPVM